MVAFSASNTINRIQCLGEDRRWCDVSPPPTSSRLIGANLKTLRRPPCSLGYTMSTSPVPQGEVSKGQASNLDWDVLYYNTRKSHHSRKTQVSTIHTASFLQRLHIHAKYARKMSSYTAYCNAVARPKRFAPPCPPGWRP